MTAVEVYQGGSIGESIVVFGNLAGQIAKTEFVPEAFRNRPEAVLACMLFGQECGLPPMASLNLTQSIKGKVGLKPEGMRAVVQARGHRIWTEEYGDEKVVLCGQRRGEEHVERVTWTLADAKRAELTSNGSWKKYPRAMLLARATSELCRLVFSDVTGGIAYGPDELDEMTADVVVDVPASRRRAAPVAVAEVASEPQQQHVARTRPPERAEIVDTPELPPSTGTWKRKPPTAGTVAATKVGPDDPISNVDVVEQDPPASEQQVKEIARRLESLIPADKPKVMAAWADRGLPGFYLPPAADKNVNPEFTAIHASSALALLTDFGGQPTLDGGDTAA